MSTYSGVKAHLAKCLNSVLNVKALVGAFNQEKVLVGAFFMIAKTGCGTDGALHSTRSEYLGTSRNLDIWTNNPHQK